MTFFSKLWQRKGVVAVMGVVVVGGGYYWYQSSQGGTVAPRYVTAAVTRGTLSVSISGTGQVAVSNQLDVKPKASGDVLRVAVTDGQKVAAGAVLVQLDSTQAQKAIRDANANLAAAKLSLAQLQQPADQLSLLQAQNAVAQANQAKLAAAQSATKSYEDGFNTVANAFLSLPSIMAGLSDALLGSAPNTSGQQNKDYYIDAVKGYDVQVVAYGSAAVQAYQTARTAYDATFNDYNATSRSSDNATIESLINETYQTTNTISAAVKAATTFIQFYEDQLTSRNFKPSASAVSAIGNLTTYTGEANTSVANLLAAETTIQNDKDGLVSADQSVAEKTAALAKLQAGADALSIQSQELSITQRQNALLDAQATLADYTVRAPFDGIMAAVAVKVGDTVSSGTAIGTLITTQHLADITLNEVDVAKIKLGQKVVLTFDAIDGLTLSGSVADIASLGTVSQGVVSYDVKIGFDAQDDRIKTGMSVAAAIITNVDQDVLLVPSAAVKTQGQQTYVQELENGTPVRHQVQAVLANDTSTEVTGDVKEGDQVVTQTITSGAAASTTRTGTSILGGGNATFRLGGVGGVGR